MVLDAKQRGSLGELLVSADLVRKGYEVFREVGDNSRIDLIVLDKNCYPIKIQVKNTSVVNGVAILNRVKTGPGGYRFTYENNHADVYALVISERNIICYIPKAVLMSKIRGLSIRVDPARNNNSKLVHKAEDYLSFEGALRDCTQDPQK